MTADGAILGAQIRTLDARRPRASAVAWRHGRITIVGDDAEVREACDRSTELLDGRGLTVTPGLVDAHQHPLFIEQTRGADLTRCGTLAQVQAALVAERAARHDGDWVLGWGLEYGVYGDGAISGESIETCVDGAPALLTFMDQHTAVATTAALERSGLRGGESFAEGAAVVVANGAPTGELREFAAMARVRAVIPALSARDRRSRAAAFLRRLNGLGIAGVHVMNGDADDYNLVAELEAAGELSARLIVPVWVTPDMSDSEMEALLALRRECGRRWRGGVAKFFIDGVVETGTAWLEEPDTEGRGQHPNWPDPQRYVDVICRFAEAGFPSITHAIGDRAVRAALDAYRAAGQVARGPHRVEHIETMRDSQLPRFAAQGVAASQQAIHLQWMRSDLSDPWSRSLGPELSGRGFRLGDIRRSGAILALGSDWPVAGYDPPSGNGLGAAATGAGQPRPARLRRRRTVPDATGGAGGLHHGGRTGGLRGRHLGPHRPRHARRPDRVRRRPGGVRRRRPARPAGHADRGRRAGRPPRLTRSNGV